MTLRALACSVVSGARVWHALLKAAPAIIKDAEARGISEAKAANALRDEWLDSCKLWWEGFHSRTEPRNVLDSDKPWLHQSWLDGCKSWWADLHAPPPRPRPLPRAPQLVTADLFNPALSPRDNALKLVCLSMYCRQQLTFQFDETMTFETAATFMELALFKSHGEAMIECCLPLRQEIQHFLAASPAQLRHNHGLLLVPRAYVAFACAQAQPVLPPELSFVHDPLSPTAQKTIAAIHKQIPQCVTVHSRVEELK